MDEPNSRNANKAEMCLDHPAKPLPLRKMGPQNGFATIYCKTDLQAMFPKYPPCWYFSVILEMEFPQFWDAFKFLELSKEFRSTGK